MSAPEEALASAANVDMPGLPAVPDEEPTVSPSSVPDDLARWFAGGQILAERHNLPRIQGRWRVVEVVGVLGDPGDPYVVKGEWREFKTEDGAVKYRNRLVAQGTTALIQSGFVFWPDPDEMPERDHRG